jgi:hypothetical protein
VADLQQIVTRALVIAGHDSSSAETTATGIGLVLEHVPDGWARVDGEWRCIPTDHYVDVRGAEYVIEHTLSCRFADGGMHGCHWNFERVAISGKRLASGRYRIVETERGAFDLVLQADESQPPTTDAT